MILKEKERTTIEDLQTQEKSCIEKYGRYAQQAKDPELKNLFQTLEKKEREHYDSALLPEYLQAACAHRCRQKQILLSYILLTVC